MMKTRAMQITRWVKLPVFLLALCAMESSSSIAQKLLTAADVFQQPSRPASISELPQVTAETKADLMVIHHKYLEAIATYNQITPQTPRIYNKIGVAYEHMFMDQAAKANFEHALKIDPKYGQAYNNLGTIYFHEKNYKHAERYYKKSIKLDTKNPSVYGNLGTLYITKRKFHDGAEAYQRAFVLDPDIFHEIAENGIAESASLDDLANMNFCFAKIFAQAGMNDLAFEYLQKAISQGFHDKAKLQQDQEFASLRKTPEFQQLIAGEHR